ncbi:hypothetical protein Mapa_017722 [Marchantia paleacea]|nr:hypothetical protein Mapa_017722 [Marchantia paleacea]
MPSCLSEEGTDLNSQLFLPLYFTTLASQMLIRTSRLCSERTRVEGTCGRKLPAKVAFERS